MIRRDERIGGRFSGRAAGARPGAAFALAAVATLLAACATLPKADVTPREDGALTVRVQQTQSVRALAVNVYGDVGLADALAEAAGIPPGEPVAAGSVLTLPEKRDLEARIATARRAEKLRDEGREAQRAGDWEKAVRKYREAMELRPDTPDLRRSLGVALRKSGKLEESLQLLRACAIIAPDDAETRYALGAALRESGDLEGALEELDAAVELDETHARAHYDRARTLVELGRRDEAREAYRTFLFAFPADPWAEEARRALDELTP